MGSGGSKPKETAGEKALKQATAASLKKPELALQVASLTLFVERVLPIMAPRLIQFSPWGIN